MKVTVKRKTKAGSSRHIPGDKRWRNTHGKSGYRNMNQRKMIRATLNPRSVRKGGIMRAWNYAAKRASYTTRFGGDSRPSP